MTGLDEAFDDDTAHTAPIWAVFGDLMAGLLGAFVLILVGVLVVQIDLVASLKQEVEKRQIEEQRRMALEKALAIPLASGRVTVNNGRIGISGSVLFAAGSDELRPVGRQLLKSLVQPLQVYLRQLIENYQKLYDESPVVLSYSADSLAYAIIICSIIPVLAIYPYIQKYFAKGVNMGGVKG